MRIALKFLLLLFCLSLNHLNAQISYLDSLTLLIKEARTEEERIYFVNQKIERLSAINLDSAVALAKINKEDARRAKYLEGEAYAAQNIYNALITKGDYSEAEKYILEAKALNFQAGDSNAIGTTYSGYGMFYGVQSKYDSAAFYYKKAIDLYERIGNYKPLGSMYGNLAISYLMQSNYPQALIYQQKSLKAAREQNNRVSQAYTLMNMGSTYQNLKDSLHSEESFLAGIEIAKSENLLNVELYGYSNISALYFDQGRWDDSYSFAMKAASLAEESGDQSMKAASLTKAALTLLKVQRLIEADSLISISIEVADSANQPLAIYQAYSGKGMVLVAQAKYEEAIQFLEKGIGTLSSAGIYGENLAESYKQLSLSYEKTGRFQEALSNYKLSAEMVDSIRNEDNIREATEITMKSDFEKKQVLAEVIQAKKDAEAQKKQFLLIGGLGIVLLLAIGGWISYRNKNKVNRLLLLQKGKVESTLAELKSTQAQLIQSEKMASLGELTAGIAHEIQNPLNFVNNFSELTNEMITELEEERGRPEAERDEELIAELLDDMKENLLKINHHGNRADSIVKGMLLHSRQNSGEKELTDLNELADEYLRLAYHGLRAKDKTFNADIQTDLDPNLPSTRVIRQDMGRVLLNLLNNAFYSVNERKRNEPEGFEPKVKVISKEANSKIMISVTDNGNGISANILNKIFQPFYTTKPSGQGTGLGLSLSYDIVTKGHNGDLLVESKEGEGITFTILIPKQPKS